MKSQIAIYDIYAKKIEWDFFPVAGLFGGFVPFLLASSLPLPHLSGYNKVTLEFSCRKKLWTKNTYIRKKALFKYDSIP